MMRYILTFLLSVLYSAFAFAQDVEMADGLRSDGKIYIVVAVLLIVFTGIVIYLINIDKKVSKLEKEISNK
jgi:CcmD family protein